MGATYRVRRRKSAQWRGGLAHFAERSAHFSWRSARWFRRSAHSCDGPLTSSGAALAFRTAPRAHNGRPLTPNAGLLTLRAGLDVCNPTTGHVEGVASFPTFTFSRPSASRLPRPPCLADTSRSTVWGTRRPFVREHPSAILDRRDTRRSHRVRLLPSGCSAPDDPARPSVRRRSHAVHRRHHRR